MAKEKKDMVRALYWKRKEMGLVKFEAWVTPEQRDLLKQYESELKRG